MSNLGLFRPLLLLAEKPDGKTLLGVLVLFPMQLRVQPHLELQVNTVKEDSQESLE
jgi:hypothetical protein